MKEEWKSITGYEGLYEVSTYGRIRSLKRITIDGKHLQERFINGGEYPNHYKFVCLRKDGKNKNRLVHRLVAEAFIPNPGNCSDVNHIDGNKQNNNLNNLEWCTRSENLKHAVTIGLVKNQCKIRRKCKAVHITSGTILNFDSMKDCAKFFGYGKSWLQNRFRKTSGNETREDGFVITVQERR